MLIFHSYVSLPEVIRTSGMHWLSAGHKKSHLWSAGPLTVAKCGGLTCAVSQHVHTIWGFHKWGYPKIEGLYWKSYLVNLFQSYLVLTVLVLSVFSRDTNRTDRCGNMCQVQIASARGFPPSKWSKWRFSPPSPAHRRCFRSPPVTARKCLGSHPVPTGASCYIYILVAAPWVGERGDLIHPLQDFHFTQAVAQLRHVVFWGDGDHPSYGQVEK